MADIFDLTDMWNNVGTTFAAIRMNVTDTASQAGSMLIDLQVGGVSKFAVRKDGALATPFLRAVELVTPSGSNQATAAPVAGDLFYINSGVNFLCIRLPPAIAGRKITGCKLPSFHLNIYPAVGETINGQAANAPIVSRGSATLVFNCVETGKWITETLGGTTAGLLSVQNPAPANGRVDLWDTQQRNFLFTGDGTIFSGWGISILNAHSGTGIGFQGAANVPLSRIGSSSASDLSVQLYNTTANAYYTTMRWRAVTAQVNYFDAVGSAAASPVELQAVGTDTDIDLALAPKGTGVLRFGSHSSIASETVTGYVTIKDAGGTLRKLAVVS